MTEGGSIAVVWCDFGGVLTPPIADAATGIARASGVPWPVLWRAIEVVASEVDQTGMKPLELGLMTQAEWGRRVAAVLPSPPAIDLGRWGDYWYRDRPVDEELLAMLSRVRRSGIAVGMLTNSVREWEPHRERMLAGHPDAFDVVLRSHEVGLAKPDPRLFRKADALMPSGGAALLIDDMAVNCEAARVHGWDAHLHSDREETLGMLRVVFAGRFGRDEEAAAPPTPGPDTSRRGVVHR